MLAAFRTKLNRAADKWLFQVRAAESGEVFLNQRRVFIMPSKPGLGFAAMLIVLFVASVNYNLSLGFALTFLIAGCAIIDMHLSFRNLAHLYLAAGRAPAVFAGQEAQFELHLINRRKHARFAIWAGFVGDGLPDLEQAIDIQANSTTSILLGAHARRRGWLQAPRVRLQTRFPLGLFRAWSYWQPDATVLVYPQPEENAPPLPLSDEYDSQGEGQAGQDDFAGIRAYQAGDSMRRLAWRQIARLDSESGGALVSKHFEGGTAGKLSFDFRKLPRDLDVEARLSRMTRWVLEAEGRGLPYAFRLDDMSLPAAIGPAHQEACLRALALHGVFE